MVSGFVTSPELQLRICFEDARPISMASKLLMSVKRVLSAVAFVSESSVELLRDLARSRRVLARGRRGLARGRLDFRGVGRRLVVGHAFLAVLDDLLLG